MRFNKIYLILCCVVGVFLIYIVFLYSQKYLIRMNGVELHSKSDIKTVNVEYYLQDDQLWSSDRMGKTKWSLGGSGCLVSCFSAALSNYSIQKNPGEMNKLFSDHNVYNENGEIIWYKISEIFNSVEYQYDNYFDSATIEKDLSQGITPFVKVKYFGSGIFHWVLIVGASNKEFLIYDPLKKSKQFIPLSTHGKCYAYRKLINLSKN